MIKVRILKPAKSAMQSGSTSRKWVIEFLEEPRSRSIDNTMGWTSSKEMSVERKMEFLSSAAATEFAERNNWAYEVIEPQNRKFIKKNYSDNFK